LAWIAVYGDGTSDTVVILRVATVMAGGAFFRRAEATCSTRKLDVAQQRIGEGADAATRVGVIRP
jgi:hypothetical protein